MDNEGGNIAIGIGQLQEEMHELQAGGVVYVGRNLRANLMRIKRLIEYVLEHLQSR